MNETVKSLVKKVTSIDYQNFLLKSLNGSQINSEEVYLFRNVIGETQALIQSSIKVPGNSFFINIINGEVISSNALADSNEWEQEFKMLSDKTKKKTVTLDDISQITSEMKREKEGKYEIILSYIKKQVNRVIGKYYSEGYIENCLDCKIRSAFKTRDANRLVIDKLLSMKINSNSELKCILKSNIDLTKTIRMYGLNLLFISNHNKDKDSIIKSLILDYFISISISKKESLKKKEYYKIEYNICSDNGILETNIIKQLELILGKETLALTLTKGIGYLEEQIDIKCSKEGLGKTIINSILNIVVSHHKMDVLDYTNSLFISIREKLKKLCSIGLKTTIDNLKQSGIFTQNEIKLLENIDKAFGNNVSEKFITQEHIDYIINRNVEKLEEEHDRFCMEWENLNKTIIYNAVPRYIHKNKESLPLEELIKLGTYKLGNKSYGLKDGLKNGIKTKLIQVINKGVK